MRLTLTVRLGVLLVSAVLLAVAVVAIACAPASPSGQAEEPTATPEKKAAAEEPTPTPEPEPTPTPKPDPTPTPKPTPDPAKLPPEAHTLLALRDAIAAREEETAADSQHGVARGASSEPQTPINYGLPIPTTLKAHISTIEPEPVETFLTDNGGTIIERHHGPNIDVTPPNKVAIVVIAEFPTTLLEDLARQDNVIYILLTKGLYPNLDSGLQLKAVTRAEQLLTPGGRLAPPPQTTAIAVDATEEGFANIRQFLIDNNWDFSRDATHPDFDLIPPMSQLSGVLWVQELGGMYTFLSEDPPPTPTRADLPTSKVLSQSSSIGDGAVAHGVQAWHDAGYDGTGI